MNTFLVLGDSVTWGQGLLESHKFSTLFRTHLEAADGQIGFARLAHSGAIIGANDSAVRPALNGEIPTGYPTIRQQVRAYTGTAAEVKWIVMNGGINDVDIHRILNPMVSRSALERLTQKHCGTNLSDLLATTAFTFPNARIFVTGYYPILSYESDPLGIEALFAAIHAVEFRPLMDKHIFRNELVEHCLTFWKVSSQAMQEAVNRTNVAAGKERAVYIDTGFSEANAVFAREALLWGVDTNPLLGFPPQDEVAAARIPACEASVHDPLNCFTCCRASAGHPNVDGATQIAERLADEA